MEANNYDEKLKEILKNIRVSWDAREDIEKITNALKSKHNWIKKDVIRRYEGK